MEFGNDGKTRGSVEQVTESEGATMPAPEASVEELEAAKVSEPQTDPEIVRLKDQVTRLEKDRIRMVEDYRSQTLQVMKQADRDIIAEKRHAEMMATVQESQGNTDGATQTRAEADQYAKDRQNDAFQAAGNQAELEVSRVIQEMGIDGDVMQVLESDPRFSRVREAVSVARGGAGYPPNPSFFSLAAREALLVQEKAQLTAGTKEMDAQVQAAQKGQVEAEQTANRATDTLGLGSPGGGAPSADLTLEQLSAVSPDELMHKTPNQIDQHYKDLMAAHTREATK